MEITFESFRETLQSSIGISINQNSQFCVTTIYLFSIQKEILSSLVLDK